jgi:hypothetical protein
MKTNRRKSTLQYNTLEGRQLLAGDVTVVENGDLFIRGDELSNQIQIIANDDGEVLISGLNGTTINGSSDAFDVEGVTDLDGARGRNAAFSGGLRIQMNEGHDRVDVRGVELEGRSYITTGEGDDFFRFYTSTSEQEFTLLSGDGDDEMRNFQARFRGDLRAMTGDGHDEVTLWNSRVWNDTTLTTGAGNDSVTAAFARFTGDSQRIFTENGNDRVELNRNDVGESGLTVDTGRHLDRVIAEMTESTEMLGMIEVDGQSGMDVLDISGVLAQAEMLAAEDFENNGGGLVLSNTGDIYLARQAGDYGEPQPRRAAVRAEFDQTTLISSVEWAGTYDLNNISDSDSFVIEIYDDTFNELGDFDTPVGDPLASFTVGDGQGAAVVRTDTGDTLASRGGPLEDAKNIFSFETDIAFQMEADTAYWISIRSLESVSMGPYQSFFQMALANTGSEYQSAYFQSSLSNPQGAWNGWTDVRGWHVSLRS